MGYGTCAEARNPPFVEEVNERRRSPHHGRSTCTLLPVDEKSLIALKACAFV